MPNNRTTAEKNKPERASITIDDVADLAGVSTMTVSRVLRDTGSVAEKTTNRVLHAMNELGYVPNRIASSLAAAKATQIAVIVPSLENTVFTEVLSGIDEALDTTPYQAIIGISHYRQDKELALIRSMLGWRPAGIIIAGRNHLPETKRLLKASGTPVVEVMALTRNPIDMCVGVNQHAAGATMAQHLIDKNYRRFAYIGSDHNIDHAAQKRFAGFSSVIKKCDAAFEAVLTAPNVSGIGMGKALMEELLQRKTAAQAVYCSNDSVAVGALLQCMEMGIKVPKNMAIASFSGLDIAAAMPVQITTVDSPRRKMGYTSAEMVLQTLSGSKVKRVVDAGFKLVPGQSS